MKKKILYKLLENDGEVVLNYVLMYCVLLYLTSDCLKGTNCRICKLKSEEIEISDQRI